MSKSNSGFADWKEARRFHALELKHMGWTQENIAAAFGVTSAAVSQWVGTAETQGTEALRARPHTGRPPVLTRAEKQLIPEFLSQGAEAYGFRGEIWTCARVRKVIEWEFDVTYHKSHVARVLKELDWTPQRPVERASQRDEAAIARWRSEVWEELKKRRVWSGESWSLSMNPASTCCPPPCAPMPRRARRPACVSFRHATTCRR